MALLTRRGSWEVPPSTAGGVPATLLCPWRREAQGSSVTCRSSAPQPRTTESQQSSSPSSCTETTVTSTDRKQPPVSCCPYVLSQLQHPRWVPVTLCSRVTYTLKFTFLAQGSTSSPQPAPAQTSTGQARDHLVPHLVKGEVENPSQSSSMTMKPCHGGPWRTPCPGNVQTHLIRPLLCT